MFFATLLGYLAQAYGAGAYNNSNYQGGSTGGNFNGLLTNTGFDLLVVASIACLLVFLALLIRFWKRPSRADR
jgi:hypothetical protein